MVCLFLYIFGIFSRTFLNVSFFWIDSFIQYAFVLCALFGAATALKTDEHIKIDLLKFWIEKKQNKIIVAFVSSLLFLAILVIYVLHLKNEWTLGESSNFWVSKWVLDVPFIYLFSGAFFFSFLKVWRFVRGEKS